MTSVFRRRIAHRVLSTIEDSISKNSSLDGPDALSPLLKMNRFGRNVPQLLLPWNKLLKINPALEDCNPTTLIKAMRNQGLPNTDGVTSISFDNSPPSSIVFTLDGDIFTKAVLMDLCVNLDVMAFKSCNFYNIVPKTVLVEYSSPKLGKPLDMGYFRSTVHGNFIANINQFVGHNVTRISSIEDWGLSFALLVAGYEVCGVEDQLERNPNFHLSEVLKAAYEKCRADEEFCEKAKLYYKKMVEGDMEILSVLKKLKDPCIKEFKATYKLLGIKFDEICSDSMYSTEIIGIEQELTEKKLVDNQQDSPGNSFSPPGSDVSVPKPISKEFYSPAYSIARNIGAALYRKNRYNFDEMYYVTNASEKKKISLLFSILETMGHDWYRNIHHVRLEDIRSLKKNKKPLIAEVLHYANISVLKGIRQRIVLGTETDIDDISKVLATTSVIVDAMHHRRNRDYLFDLSKVIQITENSGISLQLCHATLTQILEESKIRVKFDTDTSPLTQAEALSLIRHLSRFEEIIFKAYYTLEPCIILQYLDTLCYLVDKAFIALSVNLEQNRLTVVKARLLLFHATQKVLHKGLQLLGVKPLERY